MSNLCVILFLLSFVYCVLPQGLGSGSNGNLRLCVVEARGIYKRVNKLCPILDADKSGIECVLGTDRLDCLRRMSKGTVDFGVFSPEDLVAAQWANIDVLVTNELRSRPKPYERSIVAVINRGLIPDSKSTAHAILRGSTLCHPGHGDDDRQPLSDTIADFLESSVMEKTCNENMSLIENRIKGMADFFGKACKAGPWVEDVQRDADLKLRYSSLCAACGRVRCNTLDRYWGASGALLCLTEGAGDVTWAEKDKVAEYFGLLPDSQPVASPEQFAYLCRDGSTQQLSDNLEPCVWINRPWRVIVAKRKAASAVTQLAQTLTNISAPVERGWKGALVSLLESNGALPEPLAPSRAPSDYLGTAQGFKEAYSQTGCQPPRHITMCTTTVLEQNKCNWLSEAGAVYGVAPPLQCANRPSTEGCLQAVRLRECDVTVANTDHMVSSVRDYSLTPILHEATPILEKMNTVVAYVMEDAKITKMADLRGKRASFPRFDGFAWHSVMRYLRDKEVIACNKMGNYFSEVCAPGIQLYNYTKDVIDKFTKNCYVEEGRIVEGETQALRSLVEGRTDVAFVSINAYNMYAANQILEPWAAANKKLVPVCPEENQKYCFISWSNIGHIYASKNLSAMRRQEIVNVFTKLDQLFGKNYPFHSAMFSMYGPFNHQPDVLFHDNTYTLGTDVMLKTYPYDKLPLGFDSDIENITRVCQPEEFVKGSAAQLMSSLIFSLPLLVLCIVVS